MLEVKWKGALGQLSHVVQMYILVPFEIKTRIVDVNESGNMFEFIINLYSMYRCIGKNTQLHKGPPSTDRNKHNHYRD